MTLQTIRDFRKRIDDKAQDYPEFRAVITAADGSRTTGSVWFDEDRRLVWYQPWGSSDLGWALCDAIEPTIGLGVIIQFQPTIGAFEVLRDDPFLRDADSSPNRRSYRALTQSDFQRGGRFQLFTEGEMFQPLAVVDAANGGLAVDVGPGYYYYNGEIKEFEGEADFDISASQPAGPNEHRLVGIYLDSSNTLQSVNGTAVSTATDASDPTWPDGAVRLAVVDLDDSQTTIDFENDIDNRRVFFRYGSSGVWAKEDKFNLVSGDIVTEYDTLADAVTAHGAGDTIIMGAGIENPGSQQVLDTSVTLIGSSPLDCIIGGSGIYVGQGCTIINVGFTQELQAGMGTNYYQGVEVEETGSGEYAVNVDSGSSGGEHHFFGCKILGIGVSSGAIRVQDSSVACKIYLNGGELSGALHPDSTCEIWLNGVLLLDASLTITVNSDKVYGWYIDNGGEVHLAPGSLALRLPTGSDVYTGGDEAGVKERSIDIFQASITDHFDGASFSGWTWASYAGFGTPSNVEMSNQPSMVVLYNSGSAQRSFAYRSSFGSIIYCRAISLLETRTGLRMDDGTNSNYLEWFLQYNSTSKLVDLVYRYAVGGSVTGPTTVVSGLPASMFMNLQMTRAGSGNLLVYYAVDGPRSSFVTTITALSAVTMTRSGIYHEDRGASGNLDRTSIFDWYKQ